MDTTGSPDPNSSSLDRQAENDVEEKVDPTSVDEASNTNTMFVVGDSDGEADSNGNDTNEEGAKTVTETALSINTEDDHANNLAKVEDSTNGKSTDELSKDCRVEESEVNKSIETAVNGEAEIVIEEEVTEPEIPEDNESSRHVDLVTNKTHETGNCVLEEVEMKDSDIVEERPEKQILDSKAGELDMIQITETPQPEEKAEHLLTGPEEVQNSEMPKSDNAWKDEEDIETNTDTEDQKEDILTQGPEAQKLFKESAGQIDENFERQEDIKEEDQTSNAGMPNDSREEKHDIPLPPIYRYHRPASVESKLSALTKNFVFALAVVDFHHIHGPELTHWLDKDGTLTNDEKVAKWREVWPFLAFQGLPDGVHMYDETFTHFTLRYDQLLERGVELSDEKIDIYKEGITSYASSGDNEEGKRSILEMEDPNQGTVTLFGCACIRQIESKKLNNEEDIKRSIVQKSVLLITRAPLPIQMKEQLSIVTQAWFEQFNFKDIEILTSFYDTLDATYNLNGYIIEHDEDEKLHLEGKKVIKESDFYMGLNFQACVEKLRRNLLLIFKALITGEKRILIFSKQLNDLSNIQYCLIGLVTNLLLNLGDCGFPFLDSTLFREIKKCQSMKSSDRCSVMNFLGLPLNIFGLNNFFQPYMTLQQLEEIYNCNVKSFLIGTSNDIVLENKRELFDIVVYLDERENGIFGSGGCKIEIFDNELKECGLTWDDKKFIDFIVESVIARKNGEDLNTREGDDDAFNGKTVNANTSIENGEYKGGNEFIRSQFEDYLIGLLSCIKYDNFLSNYKKHNQLNLDIYENDIARFGVKYVDMFTKSNVYKYWNLNHRG
ncbi:unnamed protein product [Pichia kudriavzevii]